MSADINKLNRAQLYEKIWSAPASKLSAEFGISDVAIAKRCKKLGIPRPPRGYWAKLAAGKKVKRAALPPPPEVVALQKAKDAVKAIGKTIPLEKDENQLHPLAKELLNAIRSKKPSGNEKRVRLHERPLPETDISKELALRAAQAFHALLEVLEAQKIFFRKSQSSFDGGHFRKGHDRLHFKIEEKAMDRYGEIIQIYYGERGKPCGKLTFNLNENRYSSRVEKSWTEGEGKSFQALLADIARFISNYFLEAMKRRQDEAKEHEKQRIESELRHKEWLKEEAIRKEEEARKKHEESLDHVVENRQNDLLKAAEWWQFHKNTMEFISECERRWLQDGGSELTSDQQAWLEWARETAHLLSPFSSGYPQPDMDGSFNPEKTPFGGPYPQIRDFPRPPSMPVLPEPVVIKDSYGTAHHKPVEQYPFWLKHPRR